MSRGPVFRNVPEATVGRSALELLRAGTSEIRSIVRASVGMSPDGAMIVAVWLRLFLNRARRGSLAPSPEPERRSAPKPHPTRREIAS